MNIDEHIESCLKFFEVEAAILDEILFIGAWARYFYRDHFKKSADYQARMLTKDLDILLSTKSIGAVKRVDVHEKLISAGFHAEFLRGNHIKYFRDALELEFLVPAKGAPSEKAVHVKQYNLNAIELPHLSMLWRSPISVRYGKFSVNVPDPMDFAIHKILISSRRAKPESAEQDRRDAEEVLYALNEGRDFEGNFKNSISTFAPNKKNLTAMRKGIDTFLIPTLREKVRLLFDSHFG